MTKKKQDETRPAIPEQMAVAVVACRAMFDIHQVRRTYPSAMSDRDARDAYREFSDDLFAVLEDCGLKDIQRIAPLLNIDHPSASDQLFSMYIRALTRCTDPSCLPENIDDLPETWQQTEDECRKIAPDAVNKRFDRLLEIEWTSPGSLDTS